jgi:hypothetical protein
MIYSLLILPGLVAAYFMLLRPILHGLPALKEFYTEADGFWSKICALAGHSATLAWSYGVMAAGWALQWLDPLASLAGDPDFKSQLTNTLQANPKVLGYVLMGTSAITIAARMRSIGKGA